MANTGCAGLTFGEITTENFNKNQPLPKGVFCQCFVLSAIFISQPFVFSLFLSLRSPVITIQPFTIRFALSHAHTHRGIYRIDRRIFMWYNVRIGLRKRNSLAAFRYHNRIHLNTGTTGGHMASLCVHIVTTSKNHRSIILNRIDGS